METLKICRLLFAPRHVSTLPIRNGNSSGFVVNSQFTAIVSTLPIRSGNGSGINHVATNFEKT